jgi:dynein heavy chain
MCPVPFSLIELRAKVTDINRAEANVKTATSDDATKFPPNPYQNVALQECETMSLLLNIIRTSLEELELGLKGDLNMTDTMEKLAESLTINRVPANWAIYYFNKKPLASWFSDLKDRYNQLEKWSDEFKLP